MEHCLILQAGMMAENSGPLIDEEVFLPNRMDTINLD